MSNQETQDQIAAVMLQTGTPEQQKEAIAYCTHSNDEGTAAPEDIKEEPAKPVTALSLAMAVLKEAMTNGPDYAWSWQCNLAMSVFDSGVDHQTSNEAAARFIRLLCDVDMTRHPYYLGLEKQWLVDKAKAALKQETLNEHYEVERLRRDCSEAHVIIDSIMHNMQLGYYVSDIQRVLENLSAAAAGTPRPHEDLLPWPKA